MTSIYYSLRKEVYTPKNFFLHAASLGQAFAHCRIFSTAASRRSGTRISVSLLGNSLSAPLPVIGLVSHYLTNYLIGPRPIKERIASLSNSFKNWNYWELPHLSISYAQLFGMYQGITNPSATPNHKDWAYDLHALSTPLAFILDQDQILNKKIENF